MHVKKSPVESDCPLTVGFRLDPEARAALSERAKVLGVSCHELARHYVLLMLCEQQDRAETRNAIVALNKEIVELRTDLSVATVTLLTSAGTFPQSKAREWAEQNLRPS